MAHPSRARKTHKAQASGERPPSGRNRIAAARDVPRNKAISGRPSGENTGLAAIGEFWRVNRWIVLLLIVVVAAVFWPAHAAQFTAWDDDGNVSKNPSLNPPTIRKIAEFWVNPYLDLYIPLTYTLWGVLALIAQLPEPTPRGFWLDPAVFHTANILVHALTTVAVFALLWRLIRQRWPAALGALLFAVHPLQVESVAWVTGMKDVLCGLLSMAALWQYVCYAQRWQIDARGGWRWNYAMSIALFVLALLAKPSAVMVPFLAVTVDWLLLRRSPRTVVVGAAPLIVLAVACAIAAKIFQTVSAPEDGGQFYLRPLIAGDALAFYLYKLALPLHLSVYYDRAPMTLTRNGALYYTYLVPLAIGAVLLLARRRYPWLIPAALLFLLPLLPVLGLVPFAFQRYSTVADRYAYVAMLGPALALGFLLSRSRAPTVAADHSIPDQAPQFPAPRPAPATQVPAPARRRALFAIAIAALTALAATSFAQAFYWHDNLSLFFHARAEDPHSAPADAQIAAELVGQGKFDEAIGYAAGAIELDPKLVESYRVLGVAQNSRGELPGTPPDRKKHCLEEAMTTFEHGLRVNPRDPELLDMYGAGLYREGLELAQSHHLPEARIKLADAEKHLRLAIAEKPELAEAHLNLASLLMRGNRYDQAFKEIQTSVALDPGSGIAQALDALLLHAVAHNDSAAQAHLRIALLLSPADPQVITVAKALASQGVRDAAPGNGPSPSP